MPSFMKKSFLAVSSLALTMLFLPTPALAAPLEAVPAVSSRTLAAPEDTVVDTAFTTLQDQILLQEKLSQAKIAAEKKAAEEQVAAAVKAREDRNALIKKKLGVTADNPDREKAFSLLTEADFVNLSKTPCTTDEEVSYSNGKLPATALCALSTTSHFLRPHAAVAFNALSSAFEREFKTPLCITDSYRSYDAQVKLKEQKPTLAAKPGTSNHGWGLAVDLCGGVQVFGSAEHEWMKAYAPSFGWVHPSWAQKTGSKPEPWHWEYVAVGDESLPA